MHICPLWLAATHGSEDMTLCWLGVGSAGRANPELGLGLVRRAKPTPDPLDGRKPQLSGAGRFFIRNGPSARYSRLELRRVSMAWSGDAVMGDPCRLKLVFRTPPTPVRLARLPYTRKTFFYT